MSRYTRPRPDAYAVQEAKFANVEREVGEDVCFLLIWYIWISRRLLQLGKQARSELSQTVANHANDGILRCAMACTALRISPDKGDEPVSGA